MNRTNQGPASGLRLPTDPLTFSRDPLRLIVATLIFLTVSRLHQHFLVIGRIQPAMLLFLAAVGWVLFNPGTVRRRNVTDVWPPKVVLGLGLMAVVSVPFALSIGTAGSFFVNAYSKVLLVFLLVVMTLRKPEDLKLYVWSYVLACGALVYLSIFVFQLGQAGNVMRLGSLYTYDSNDLGLVLSTGMPLCLVLFQNTSRAGKIVSALILFGIGVSLARSGSRGAFLGLATVGVMILFFVTRFSLVKRLGFLAAAVVGLVLFAPQGYWEQMRTMTEPTEDYNWTSPYGRKAVAERGLGYMMSHPVTGVGVGNFRRAEGLLADIAEERRRAGAGYRWTAAHNSFVQVGAELGIPGLILFCVLVFGTAVGMFRLRRRLPRGWRSAGGKPAFLHDMALYLPVSLVAFAVTGFFLSFAYMDIIYLLAAFVTAVYLGVRRERMEMWYARHRAQQRVAGEEPAVVEWHRRASPGSRAGC